MPPPNLRLKPTMIIGLGGTGKEVLLRIRRLFYERKGRNSDGSIGYPIVGYLLVDTDGQKTDKIKGENLTPFVAQNIRLGMASGVPEFIHCKVDEAAFHDYFAGGNTYPHIARWLDPDFNRHGAVAIAEGAGQNRPFGRLAFFHHYQGTAQNPGIRDTIESRIREILAKAALPNLVARWREEGTEVDASNLEVVLVYSLAGGTGAGMFLDMGMLVRDIISELGIAGLQPHLTHIAVLPEAFVNRSFDDLEGGPPIQVRTMKEKIQENAFAALREMEYFAMRRGKDFDLAAPPPVPEHATNPSQKPLYVAEWTEGHKVEIKDAPWNTCYLVGASNDTMGGAFVPSREIFQMISEYIFLDFDPSEFGAHKRALRSNQQDITLETFLDEVKETDGRVLYRRPLSRRFRLFGLSQIYFDRARMRRAAGYRLAERLISEYWLRDPGLSPKELDEIAKLDLTGGVNGEPTSVTRTGDEDDAPIRLASEAVRDRLVLQEGMDSKGWFHLIQDESDSLKGRLKSGKLDGQEDAAVTEWLERHDVRLSRRRATAGENGLVLRSFEVQQDRLLVDIDKRTLALFLFRIGELGTVGTTLLLNEYNALGTREAVKADGLANKEPKLSTASWRDRLAEARELPLARYARAAVKAEAGRAISGMRNYLADRYLKAVAPMIRDSLDHFVRQVSIRPNEASPTPSYARSLARFGAKLAAGESDDGVIGYLRNRFAEHSTQGGEPARTVPLLSHSREADYDAMIRKSPQITTLNRGMRQETMNWPAIENEVLEKLRAAGDRWADARGLGRLILTVCPLADSNGITAKEFAGALAEACEALLEGFAAEKTALAQFYSETPEKRDEYLDLLRTYAAPYLRYARTNRGPASNTHLDVYLGIAASPGNDDSRKFQADVINPNRPNAQQAVLGLLQPLGMKDDALVLYQEKVGIPICYYQGLEELGRKYDASARVKEAHFDFPALHAILPEIRMADHSKQHIIGEMLQYSLLGIMTRRIRYSEGVYSISRNRGAGAIKTAVGRQFQDVVRYLVAEENRDDRDNVSRQVNDWLRLADEGDGGSLAALWCGLQAFHEEVRQRVQYLLDSDQRLERGLQGDHPLMLVLWERMIPRAQERLARHPQRDRVSPLETQLGLDLGRRVDGTGRQGRAFRRLASVRRTPIREPGRGFDPGAPAQRLPRSDGRDAPSRRQRPLVRESGSGERRMARLKIGGFRGPGSDRRGPGPIARGPAHLPIVRSRRPLGLAGRRG